MFNRKNILLGLALALVISAIILFGQETSEIFIYNVF